MEETQQSLHAIFIFACDNKDIISLHECIDKKFRFYDHNKIVKPMYSNYFVSKEWEVGIELCLSKGLQFQIILDYNTLHYCSLHFYQFLLDNKCIYERSIIGVLKKQADEKLIDTSKIVLTFDKCKFDFLEILEYFVQHNYYDIFLIKKDFIYIVKDKLIDKINKIPLLLFKEIVVFDDEYVNIYYDRLIKEKPNHLKEYTDMIDINHFLEYIKNNDTIMKDDRLYIENELQLNENCIIL
jgi:hypothetical protein